MALTDRTAAQTCSEQISSCGNANNVCAASATDLADSCVCTGTWYNCISSLSTACGSDNVYATALSAVKQVSPQHDKIVFFFFFVSGVLPVYCCLLLLPMFLFSFSFSSTPGLQHISTTFVLLHLHQ